MPRKKTKRFSLLCFWDQGINNSYTHMPISNHFFFSRTFLRTVWGPSHGLSPFTYSCRHLYALLWKHSLWKNLFPFLDTFTLIDTSLYSVDHILQTMIKMERYSIMHITINIQSDNNIQFTYGIKNNGVLPFLDTLVSRTNKGFLTSVYLP